jgi:hypothetical protein
MGWHNHLLSILRLHHLRWLESFHLCPNSNNISNILRGNHKVIPKVNILPKDSLAPNNTHKIISLRKGSSVPSNTHKIISLRKGSMVRPPNTSTNPNTSSHIPRSSNMHKPHWFKQSGWTVRPEHESTSSPLFLRLYSFELQPLLFVNPCEFVRLDLDVS